MFFSREFITLFALASFGAVAAAPAPEANAEAAPVDYGK
jgi:hypothetical protein